MLPPLEPEDVARREVSQMQEGKPASAHSVSNVLCVFDDVGDLDQTPEALSRMRSRAEEWAEADRGGDMKWSVVAAGPSLDDLNPDDVREMPNVVAVNRALYWLQGHCPYWACGEKPEGLWRFGGLEETSRLAVGVTVWCPELPYAPHWRREFPRQPLETYDSHMSPEDPYGWVDPGWETEEPWRGGTTVQAIAQCCKRGAKEITVIGCDMRGTGGWGYGFLNQEAPEWAERWERERGSMQRAIQDAAEHGVEVNLL